MKKFIKSNWQEFILTIDNPGYWGIGIFILGFILGGIIF